MIRPVIRRGWTNRAVIRYTVIQIPGSLLVAVVLIACTAGYGLPAWIGWLAFALWTAKDVVLFFFLWPAYDDHSRNLYSLNGKQATVRTGLDPNGSVLVNGQIWQARVSPGSPPLGPGVPVRVVKRDGLTLIVCPLTENETAGEHETRSLGSPIERG